MSDEIQDTEEYAEMDEASLMRELVRSLKEQVPGVTDAKFVNGSDKKLELTCAYPVEILPGLYGTFTIGLYLEDPEHVGSAMVMGTVLDTLTKSLTPTKEQLLRIAHEANRPLTLRDFAKRYTAGGFAKAFEMMHERGMLDG